LNKLVHDKNLSKNVNFLGQKDIYSIINEYENSDIGIFLSAEETFGLVPLEMLASGLPVVCSETGIMSDLCKNNITLDSLEIVNADHYQDIAKRVLSLVRHCKQTTLNKSTHFIKKNFSTSVISKAYELEYQQILGHRK
jgi:glycosyltransferase involved in cell wall biosynthesis